MPFKQILQGRFLSHPLHAALVHIPIGLWLASLIFDIAAITQDLPEQAVFFTRTAFYCILVGVIAAVPAALTGVAEFVDIANRTRAQAIALAHLVINVILISAYLIQLVLRADLPTTTNAMLALNLCSTVLLGISGYLGGKLAYEYRIGSRAPEVVPSIEPQQGPRQGRKSA